MIANQFTFKLTSMKDSPILFNRRSFMLDLLRDSSLKKSKNEEDLAHQMRIFKLKCEYNLDKNVIIPAQHIKKAMGYSQMLTCHPLAPKGATKRNATLSKLLPAIIAMDIDLGVKADDLQHFDAYVCIGMKKSSVLSVRPMLNQWQGNLTLMVATDLIDREILLDMLEWCGLFCGVGDWRPERGGKYGRFMVE
jgi:hypothetical protein